MKNKEPHSEFTFQIEPKHYFKHNYLTYCNDVLVSMLKYVDEEKMSSVRIDFDNGENKEFEQVENWQEWLITHGHREEMYEAYYRHTFFSLSPGTPPHRNSKGTAFRLFLYIRVFSCVMNTRHGARAHFRYTSYPSSPLRRKSSEVSHGGNF